MFASKMKILMIHTNNASPTAQGSGGKQPIITELNNSNNDGNEGDRVGCASVGSNHKPNKREQKHNINKKKFIHANNKMQQQQQPQKYHHKNNNSNGSKLKNQHYNNSNNNNSTSSLNRKKYYQQQQHHQQQQQHYQQHHYFAAVQQNIYSTQTTTTITNNSKSNLVKHQNYTNINLLIQQQQEQQQERQHNIANTNTNTIKTCTCLLQQQSNCDKLSLLSCSSGSPSLRASSLRTATGDNHQSKTSLSNATQARTPTATPCINCLSNYTEFSQQQQSAICSNFKSTDTTRNLRELVASAVGAESSKSNSKLNLTRTTSSSTTTPILSGGQSHLSSNTTSSLVSKKKSFWKNTNSYTLGNTTQSPKLSKEKQHHVLDKNLITSTSKHSVKNSNNNGNGQKYSTTLAANVNTTQQKQNLKHQVQGVGKIEMSTSLATSSGSTSTKTSVSNNNSTSTTPSKQQQDSLEKYNDSKQTLKLLSNNNNSNTDINKTTLTSSSPTPTSSAPSSPNSYTLDFLHSVGVKMTGVALRSPGLQGSTNAYGGNQSTSNSPAHSTYPYAGMTTNPRQPRYMYGGSNTNNGNSGNQQPHYHQHHQPSPLTIASFLHKDLLGGDNLLSNANNTSSSRAASSAFSSNSRSVNNYNDQQHQQHYTQQPPPTHTRYHHDYYTTPYQQQSAVIPQKSCRGGEGYSGEVARLVTNGSGGSQRSTGYAYTNYHNAARDSGVGKNSAMVQQHSRQLQSNVGNYKNSVSQSQINKKSYTSSSNSTCSSSSAKSISNISSRQLQTAANQDSNNSSSNLNLAIETLQSKSIGGGNQRSYHRGHHHNHHGHHHGNHHYQHSMMNSPNVLQHQNYYNLTYVTTEGSAKGATSRGCSPSAQTLPSTSLSTTNCHSLDNNPGHVAMLMNFNATHLQYPRYTHTQQLAGQQQQQFPYLQHTQHQNYLNKKLLVPLTLNMPSPSSSPTPQPYPANVTLNSQQTPAPQNIICCSQLDEVTTAAAAAAATSSSSSGIVADNDCDSDTSSNHSSSQNKYHSLKSVKSSVSSSSSSSSASSISLTRQHAQQRNCSQPTIPAPCLPTTLNSTLDYNYIGSPTQAFPNLQVAQQPQLPQIYGNNSGAVISLLNIPSKSPNSYADEDYQQQQQQFYFNATASQRSADHLNIASALTTVANHSNNSSGYWSPPYRSNQFLYHQTSAAQVVQMPPNISSSSSCDSSSASISPRLPNDDMEQQTQQRLQNSCYIASSSVSPSPCTTFLNEQFRKVIVGNSTNADSGMLLACSPCSSNSSSVSSCNNENAVNTAIGGHTYKRSSSQLLAQQQRLIAPHTYQSSSSSTSSLSSSSASTLTSAVRARIGSGGENGINTNNGRHNQLPVQSTTSPITSTVGSGSISGVQQLPPTPTQHIYVHHQQQLQSLPPPLPPHNLLYNNPQTLHIRALSSSSISSSVHDFFTHTPPDRFLARAHLIEAKEAPTTLLNNSKWDYLSEGIWKKFINSQQTEKTFKQKMSLWRYLYIFIKNAYPRYGLYLVGSTISGFGSDSSDVDMCLVSRSASSIDPRLEALFNLTVLRDCLSKSGEFENFNLIEAKVPILRFCDRMHRLEVDLNFNNCVGIKNTHLLYCYSQLDWRLRPLVLVTKLWAQYHNINNAKNMTISSYSLVLMVIHFLQYAVNPPVLPCLHEIFPDKFPLLRSNDFGYVDMNETIVPYDSKNTQTIGELFLLFLEYYSCFDYTQFAISVRTGGLLPITVCRTAKSIKNDVHQWRELCIEEPFDLTNTARSVYDFETFKRVKAVFMASWRILQETLDLNSIFSTIMIPSPCSTESITMLQNKNPTTSSIAFSELDADIDGTDTKLSYEQYVKDFSVTTTASDIYEENNKSSIEQDDEECVVDGDGGDVTDEGDGNLTVTNSSFAATSNKRKDLNRTLTPRQNIVYGEKEFPLSPAASSSMNYLSQTSTKNINSNNNNKTATTMIS